MIIAGCKHCQKMPQCCAFTSSSLTDFSLLHSLEAAPTVNRKRAELLTLLISGLRARGELRCVCLSLKLGGEGGYQLCC